MFATVVSHTTQQYFGKPSESNFVQYDLRDMNMNIRYIRSIYFFQLILFDFDIIGADFR